VWCSVPKQRWLVSLSCHDCHVAKGPLRSYGAREARKETDRSRSKRTRAEQHHLLQNARDPSLDWRDFSLFLDPPFYCTHLGRMVVLLRSSCFFSLFSSESSLQLKKGATCPAFQLTEMKKQTIICASVVLLCYATISSDACIYLHAHVWPFYRIVFICTDQPTRL
jgi:hypothetical protein